MNAHVAQLSSGSHGGTHSQMQSFLLQMPILKQCCVSQTSQRSPAHAPAHVHSQVSESIAPCFPHRSFGHLHAQSCLVSGSIRSFVHGLGEHSEHVSPAHGSAHSHSHFSTLKKWSLHGSGSQGGISSEQSSPSYPVSHLQTALAHCELPVGHPNLPWSWSQLAGLCSLWCW